MLKRTLFLTLVATAIFADEDLATSKIAEKSKIVADNLSPQLPRQMIPPKTESNWFDLGIYGGYINGKSEKSVYFQEPTGAIAKRSQLDWEIKNLFAVGGFLKLRFFEDGVYFSLNGWNKATSQDAPMMDRDWTAEDPSILTHVSWSTSQLKNAYEIETEFGFNFEVFKNQKIDLKLGPLFGVEYLYLDWNESGGFFVYDEYAGFSNSDIGISYQEFFSIPYSGLQAIANWNKSVKIILFSKYSNSAQMKNHDIHHFRDMTFDNEFTNAKYWIVGTDFRFLFSKFINCDLKYEYEQMNHTRGIRTIQKKGESAVKYKGAGIFHQHQTLSLGLAVSF